MMIEILPVICEIPGCLTTQAELDEAISIFSFEYCSVCERYRCGSLCECPYPCTLTFRSVMLQKVKELIQIPPGVDSVRVCFKHTDLIAHAKASLLQEKEATFKDLESKCLKVKYKNYNELILLKGIHHLRLLFHDVTFLCSDGKYVTSSSLLVASLSSYMKEALKESSYSFCLPDIHSGDLELFFQYLLSDSEYLRSSLPVEDMLKIMEVARTFNIFQFTEVKKKHESDEEMEIVEETMPDPIYLNPEALIYTCVLCSETMSQSMDIIAHYGKVHGRQSGLDCDLCQTEPPYREYFKSPKALSTHRLHEHGTLDFLTNCELCPEPCFTKERLELHIKEMHPREYDPAVCELCDDLFPRESYLSKHRIMEHESSTEFIANEFICIHCHCQFEHLEMLNEHTERAHTLDSWVLDPPEKLFSSFSVPSDDIQITFCES